MKITKEFNYSISPVKMIFPLVFFAVCGGVLFREAMTNDRGLIIDGIFRLNAEQGTIFYYILAGLSCVFVLGAIAAIINGLTVKQKLIIYSDGLSLPVKKETMRFYFGDIASAHIMDIYKTCILEFVTRDNRKYSITDAKLKNKAEFDEVSGLIFEGLKNAGVKP